MAFIILLSTINSVKAELPLSLVEDYNKELVNSNSNPNGFKIYKGKVLFFARSEQYVNSLYSYDTVSGKNEKLADINTSFDLGRSNVTNNGVLFVEDSHPIKLWVSDGTVTGTHVISELGNKYSESYSFVSKQFQNNVIFSIGENGDILLYKSDGTSENTILIERIKNEGSDYWKRVGIIENDDSIIASYQDNYFYFFDEENNKHSSCFWESGVAKLRTTHGRIYFHAPNDLNLYFCDIESSGVKNIRDEVELEGDRIQMLFQNDSSIYFVTEQQSGDLRAIRYDPEGIKYSTPYDPTVTSTIIDGRVIFQHSSEIYIEGQLIEFPQSGGSSIRPRSRATGCLQGACFLRTSPFKNRAELLYVEFGSVKGEILHVFDPKAEIGYTGLSYGAAANKKLVYAQKTWDLGMEPHVLDLENKSESLIEDIDKTIETASSDIYRIQVIENRLYINAKTINGRQLWSYDPSSNVSTMVEDIIDTDTTFVQPQILNKIYYSRPPFDRCWEISLMIYDIDTGKRRETGCGHIGKVSNFSDGYLIGSDYSLDYFKGPALGFKRKSILYDELNEIYDIEVYGEKAYIRRKKDFVVLNEDFSYEVYETNENESRRFYSYVGQGEWLSMKGRLFKGEGFLDTQLKSLLNENDFIRFLMYSGKNKLIEINSKKFIYNTEKDSVSEFTPLLNTKLFYHNNALYQIEYETGNIYRHDFNEGVDKLFAVLGRVGWHDIRFYKDYIYYYSMFSEDSLKRVSLISGEKELLTTKFRKQEISFDEIINDEFGNVYFKADHGGYGNELWKLTNENKHAAERSYVIRHDLKNHFKFPVSLNNVHSKFKILTESKLGNIAVEPEGFSYIPNAGSFGPEIIKFSFLNELGESNIGRLNIYVNKRPTANADTLKTVSMYDRFNPLLNDDDDSNLAARHIEIVEEPKHSNFSLNSFWVLQRDQGYIGPDSFKYRLVDDEGDASEVVEVNIDFSNRNLNSLPWSEPDKYYLNKNTNIELDILANDSDPDGDNFKAVIYILPKNGGLYYVDDVLEYRPDLNFEGEDAFWYYIVDDYGQESRRVEVKLHVGSEVVGPPQSSSNSGGSIGGFYLFILVLSTVTIRSMTNRELKA
ncbi:Ig-like domain-containing protein [Pseudoalteromonas sp. T1lg75]|uniref:Ig-like domain-containing protein n=1 Tax=Pseudoalteromonas sp. T1lg75 TaxID=2077102 RepID=UPI00131A36B9|nr:Ig-like domain-containing protein [Pseudoalteromonas sp. T1lg75]